VVERLARTVHLLDVAKSHSARADDKTEELRKLNRSIFIPVITFNKDAKHAAREAKVQRRYEEERAEREKTMMDSRERMARAHAYGNRRMDDEGVRASRRNASDDEMDKDLDQNLEEIQGLVGNLKAVGAAMARELDRQNGVISGIEDKTTKLDDKLHNNIAQVREIHASVGHSADLE
jgi:transcription termination factor NusB